MAEKKVAIILTPEDRWKLENGQIIHVRDAFGNVTPIVPAEHPQRGEYVSLAEHRPASAYMG